GSPVDAMVSVMNGKASVGGSSGPRDEDGGLRIFVPAGSYTARVFARGYVSQTVNFTAGSADVRVPLSAAGKILVIASKPTRFNFVNPTMPSGPGIVGGVIGGVVSGPYGQGLIAT